MRILHLSDFHLRGDGGLSFRVVDTLECLRVVAEHLKTLVQKPDALVITGDLADSGSNQVTISSKRAELETLNEQVAQQQTENQELQRVLSGDADQITEWVARDSYNYAAPNERIFVDVTGN